MNLHNKLTFIFSIIVASILILFSVVVFMQSSDYRKDEFYERLEARCMNTANLLVSVQEVNKDLLRIIDRNSVAALPNESIRVFDKDDQLVYLSNDKNPHFIPSPVLLDQIRKEGKVFSMDKDFELVGKMYAGQGEQFVVIGTAFDQFGRSKLQNLRTVLLLGLFGGIVVTVFVGRVFASQMLWPLAKINDEVLTITAGNLSQRVDEGNRQDEIARLAMNFNLMLERLQTAFNIQKNFVSNASHELRTPLAAMRTQLQVALAKERSPDAYQQLLQSLLEDAQTLSELTNGLLMLAQSGMDNQRLHLSPIRIDEPLFAAQEELAAMHPDYRFQLDYGSFPENEIALTVKGSERLLRIAFLNFMENACKFSEDKSVYISLIFRDKEIEIQFKDNGVGIPSDELDKIFTPFYRVASIQSLVKGHGIGLSLCQSIVRLHNGNILVESTPGKGSHFSVRLPVFDNSAF